MMKYLALLALVCVLVTVNAAGSGDDTRLLREWPMIMSHDAATSMLDDITVIESYTQTQAPGSLASQLDCGARSFDYRPYLEDDGKLIAHHGGIKVKNAPMRDSVQGVIDWLAEPQNSDELVLMYVSHCDAGGDKGTREQRCSDASQLLLLDMGVHVLADCAPLAAMTVAEAKAAGRVSVADGSGGSVIAVFGGCVDENYDESINCYGFHDKREYCCYGQHKEVAWDAFESYLNNTAAAEGAARSGNLWMLQAHWQSTSVSIPLGDLHLSSVLKDEQKAGVNARVAALLRAKAVPYTQLSLVELDNVCDGGDEVLAALRDAWY